MQHLPCKNIKIYPYPPEVWQEPPSSRDTVPKDTNSWGSPPNPNH